jgi:hypothetical protein
MNSRRAVCLAAALWWAGTAASAQTVVGVGQGGTGASTPAAARSRLGAAAEVHTHSLTDLQGVTGKSGSGSVLMTFGGGGMESNTCAMFDNQGNLVSAGVPCAAQPGTTFTQSFTSATSVVMNHGMGTKHVVMACYDNSDQMVGVHAARVPTEDQAVVEFTEPQSGRCVVQGAGGMEITGAVASVFGRQGVVTAASGDYSFAQIAGVAGLGQGGTNQASWTAGRCVQVSADGARLESADDACGAGIGESSVAANSGAGAQVLKLGTNVTARTLVAGANMTVTQTEDTITIASAGALGDIHLGAGLIGQGTEADPFRVNPALVPMFVSESATLNGWGTIGAQSCAVRTYAFAGALSNDSVIVRRPANIPASLTVSAFVDLIGEMTIQICNPTAAGVEVADGYQFGATIVRSF